MTKIQARTRIKKHADENEVNVTTTTHGKVSWWWQLLNNAVFDNAIDIPPSRIIIRNFREDMLGYVEPTPARRGYHLGMRRTFYNPRTFLTVLTHEMVHAWELQEFNRMGHGKRFHSWKDTIKERTNLPLSKLVEF